MLRVAVIPTYNRPDIAKDCIASVYPQVDLVFAIDNGDKEPMPDDTENAYKHWYVIPYGEQPGNLSRAWNLGIEVADAEAGGHETWDIIVLNDDAIIPEGWVEAVSHAMREHGAAAGCSGLHDVILRQPGPVNLSMRMQGWAFMLRGEAKLRADEQFEWWYGDSDLDWQARQAGGMSMIRGYPTQNRFADQSTHGIRQVQAAADGARFLEKWGGLRAW
jgi:glycosyltransferase involved in cell wall biosynthesis